jgi:Super-infection exclusion protein B
VAWPDWLKVIQLPARFLFGLFMIGALLLFLPGNIATALGITTIRDHYRPWIGVGTIAAFALWLMQLSPAVGRAWYEHKYRVAALDNLNGLTAEERFQLAYCLHRGQRTLYLRITDSAAQSLCSKGIFTHAQSGSALALPFTIPQFVWKHIRANPHLILSDAEQDSPQLLASFARFENEIRRNQF